MGLNYYTAREILRCRADGELGSVVTIGRLQQFLLRGQADQLRQDYGLPGGPWLQRRYGEYADDFFSAAGASSLSSLDASPYEGADIVHDMNIPVPAKLRCRYDICLDGGSLEHIFRPDQALANAMRLTAVGGSLIVWTPANNLCGHGFYQFSPEFFFSGLTERSGFRMRQVLLVDCVYPGVSLVPPRAAYAVRSPHEVRERVGVLSRRPLMLLIHATKLTHVDDPFEVAPQQSDYVTEWSADSGQPATLRAGLLRAASRRARATRLGLVLAHHALGISERRRFSLHNGNFFQREQ